MPCRSAEEPLNTHAKTRLFSLNYVLERPTDASDFRNGKSKPQKYKKKTLKELTTKTEDVLPDLSFLPLHRKILNFNGD